MDGAENSAASAEPSAALVYPFGDPPEFGSTREVAYGVHWLRMPLPMASLGWINLWLIEEGEGFAAVDSGLGFAKTFELWDEIFARLGKPVTRVLCTHMHPDHAGAAGWLCERFDAPLYMTRLEYVVCRMLASDYGPAPKAAIDFYRAAGWEEHQLDAYQKRFGGFGKMVSPMPASYRRLTDGDALTIGGRVWRVIVGNGHSPEHACLLREDDHVFISGDQVLPRISSNVSVFPTEPEADPLHDWLSSCRKLVVAVPDDALVLPSHNEPFRGLHLRLNGLLAKHAKALRRVESRLKEPMRAVDLFPALFARAVGEDIGMATGEAVAHLNYLIGQGRAARERAADGTLWYRGVE